ncbi:hypothetical protein [Roseateles sp. L2-2]|uniref:hypothetical protein n=1 Tax=Roseateles TaxID=93681 RepID=UPI003D35C611
MTSEESIRAFLAGYAELSQAERDAMLEDAIGLSPKTAADNQRVWDLATPLIGLPVGEWPDFDLAWDLRLESQHHVYDGVSSSEFAQSHPTGLLVAHVNLADLDAKLTPHSYRTAAEVWGVGNDRKAAKLVVRWSEGMQITPPLVKSFSGQITLPGGNHRLAVARAKGVATVPVLVVPSDREAVQAILESLVFA